MQTIQAIIDSSNTPLITAFLLGLLTAVSPCPLTTNITAVGFISKDIEKKQTIFRNGLLYTLGRMITYTTLGIILIPILREGSSMFAIQKIISKYGELAIGPLLVLIGVFMLWGDRLNLPSLGIQGENRKIQSIKGALGALLLGIIYALAFCPTSGVFYFGMLIPMSAAESGGYLLPPVFAIATGLPVILTAWVLAFSLNNIGRFYNRMKTFEKWFRYAVATLFFIIGIYYTIMYNF